MTRHRPNPPADRMAAEQAMREQREREALDWVDRKLKATAIALGIDPAVVDNRSVWEEWRRKLGLHHAREELEDLTPDSQRIITAEEQRAMAEALQKASVAQVHGDVPADVPWPPGQIRHGPPLKIEDGT